MGKGQTSGIEKIKINEGNSLLQVGEMLELAESTLNENQDFALAQGALRAFYNEVCSFVQYSVYLTPERKNLMRKINDAVYQIRDKLVRGVEVDKKSLADVVKDNNISAVLSETKQNFKDYLKDWYGVKA